MSRFIDGQRGQTTQDFAVGIGLFLLVIVFVVSLLPAVLAPFDTVDDETRTSQAERIAHTIVEDTAVDGGLTLDDTALASLLADVDASTYSLESHRSLNVTLERLDDASVTYAGGTDYSGASAGTWTRIVTTPDGCADGCRLIVKVW